MAWAAGALEGWATEQGPGAQGVNTPSLHRGKEQRREKGHLPEQAPASERLRAQSPRSDGVLLATGACFLIGNWGLPGAASELRDMTRQVPTAACSEHPAQKVNAGTDLFPGQE